MPSPPRAELSRTIQSGSNPVPDILSQDEIDALLTATGGDDGGDAAISSAAAASPGTTKPIITYDFKHPARVSKDQQRTLENLHSNSGQDDGFLLFCAPAFGRRLRYRLCGPDHLRRIHYVAVEPLLLIYVLDRTSGRSCNHRLLHPGSVILHRSSVRRQRREPTFRRTPADQHRAERDGEGGHADPD